MLQGILVLIPAALADGNDVALALATVVAGTIRGATLTTPFTAAIFSLVYFDQRVRREGFDLELLARASASRHPIAPPRRSPTTARRRSRPSSARRRVLAPPPGWQPPSRRPPSPHVSPSPSRRRPRRAAGSPDAAALAPRVARARPGGL